MNAFKVTVGTREFEIFPALHQGFYTVNCGEQSAIIGKDENGRWTPSMQTAEAVDLPYEAIGRIIEEKWPDAIS